MSNIKTDNSINKASAECTDDISQAELEAISARWLQAAEVATLDLTITVPPEHSKVKLVQSDPSGSDAVMCIKEVELVFFLTGFDRKYATPDDLPFIRIAVECDLKAVRDHEELERSVSASISAAVGKPIIVEIDEWIKSDGKFVDFECADLESNWHLADHILESHDFPKAVAK